MVLPQKSYQFSARNRWVKKNKKINNIKYFTKKIMQLLVNIIINEVNMIKELRLILNGVYGNPTPTYLITATPLY